MVESPMAGEEGGGRRKPLTAMWAVIVFMVILALAYVFGRHDAQRVVRSAPTGAAATTALSDADVLFLEAWQRGYALDDLIVRRQLERRMRDTSVEEHPVPTQDDATLGAWLATNAESEEVPGGSRFAQRTEERPVGEVWCSKRTSRGTSYP